MSIHRSKISNPFTRTASLRTTLALPIFTSSVLAPATLLAQPALQPPFATNYRVVDLGPAPGVTPNTGGIAFKFDNPDVLLIGELANAANSRIMQVPLLRDGDSNIIGFAGPPTPLATSPNIDGGLAYAPNVPGQPQNILFATTFSSNNILQYLPGATSPTSTTALTPLGVASSTGTLQFVPEGFPGAGNLIVASYTAGTYYTMPYTPNASGVFTLGNATLRSTLANRPEGLIYVPPGSPNFTLRTALVCEYSAGIVAAFDVGPNGEPSTNRRPFITNLSNVEGAAIDPRTNQFVFAQFASGNRLYVVRGFPPVPCSLADVGSQGGNIGPNNVLDNNDFSAFITLFFQGDTRADIGRQGGILGSDGQWDNNDFAVFVTIFFDGC